MYKLVAAQQQEFTEDRLYNEARTAERSRKETKSGI